MPVLSSFGYTQLMDSTFIYQGTPPVTPPGVIAGILTILTAIVHVCFATALVQDIRKGRHKGHNPWLVGTLVWGLAALLGGVFVAALYWLMHHSSPTTQPRPSFCRPNTRVWFSLLLAVYIVQRTAL